MDWIAVAKWCLDEIRTRQQSGREEGISELWTAFDTAMFMITFGPHTRLAAPPVVD